MKPITRNIIGAMTTLMWIVAGIYMTLRGIDQTWKLVGFGVIAVGIFRGAFVLRDWNKEKRN